MIVCIRTTASRLAYAGVIAALLLQACSSPTTSPRAPTAPPGCIRAEATDHHSGVQEFTFDADGNLTLIIERDNAGTQLARTTLAWAPTRIVVTRDGAFGNVMRGELGDHGELVTWAMDPTHVVHLRWDGTFAPVDTPARARFAFETYYHVVGDEPLLPLDTASRGVWPRMRAFVFTGTVVLHRDGSPDADDTHATYDHGHQLTRVRAAVTTTTVWRGDQPIEQTASDGSRRTFASARGHLTNITGGPDVAFTYDDARNLTHVRTDYRSGGLVIDVDVSRCAN
ncbi:MAG: hypothetical protein NT062_02985 [Proteobacteria bacterium]|nr:hypothetical protein [Pseudomonadota bacterium]